MISLSLMLKANSIQPRIFRTIAAQWSSNCPRLWKLLMYSTRCRSQGAVVYISRFSSVRHLMLVPRTISVIGLSVSSGWVMYSRLLCGGVMQNFRRTGDCLTIMTRFRCNKQFFYCNNIVDGIVWVKFEIKWAHLRCRKALRSLSSFFSFFVVSRDWRPFVQRRGESQKLISSYAWLAYLHNHPSDSSCLSVLSLGCSARIIRLSI